MKRALSLLLALLMAASLVMPQAWAAGLQEPEPDAVVQQTQPDTAEPDAQLPQADTLAGNAGLLCYPLQNAVASGVTLEKVVMRNVNGSQVVGYLSEIDLSKDVTLKASYTGYYYDGSTAAQRKAMVDGGKLKWEMSQTTAQAAAYGRASDTEGRVVLATNADYYNMQTGAPTGYLIMEGNLVKTGAEPFFAILKGDRVISSHAAAYTLTWWRPFPAPICWWKTARSSPAWTRATACPATAWASVPTAPWCSSRPTAARSPCPSA